MNMWKSKKGGILDDLWIVLITIFFTGMLILVFAFAIWLSFNDKIQALPDTVASAETKADINSLTNLFLFIDKIQPFLFMALWIMVIISSLYVNPDHPVFFFISLGLCFAYTIIIMAIVDFGVAIWDNPLLLRASQELGNSSFFIHNFHLISFFVMIATLVWFYVKGNLGYNQGTGGDIPR